MKNNFLLVALFLVSLLVFVGCTQTQVNPPSLQLDAGPADDPVESGLDPAEVPDSFTGNIVAIDLVSRNWEWEPSIITVKEGDTVQLTLTTEDNAHGFSLFEFGVNERIEPGQEVFVEFVADKAGEYTFFCSVPCGRGHGAMKGTFVVE